MPTRRLKKLILSDPKRFRVLSSPRRVEIVSSLGDAGPASISQLARRLGLSSHSLYYHVHMLEKAGILKVREVRKGRRREEAIYVLAADRILLDPRAVPLSGPEEARKSLDSILRMTSREVYQALQSEAKEKGESDVYAVRFKARLSKIALRRLNRYLHRIEKILRISEKNKQSGKLFSLTIVLTPSTVKTGV